MFDKSGRRLRLDELLASPLHRYIAAFGLGAAALIIAALGLAARTAPGRPWEVCVALTVCSVILHMTHLAVKDRGTSNETQTVVLGEPAVAVAAVMLTLPWAILLPTLGSLAGNIALGRRKPMHTTMNISGDVVSATSAVVVAQGLDVALHGGLGGGYVRVVVVAALAAGLYNVSSFLTVIGAITRAEQAAGRPVSRHSAADVARAAALALPAAVGLACLATTWSWSLWAAAPFAAVVMGLANSRTRDRVHRRRLTALLSHLSTIHAHTSPDAVDRAVVAAVTELTGAQDARVQARPPDVSELGCELRAGGLERWLVMRERPRGVVASPDAELLEMLGGAANVALANAELHQALKRAATRDGLTDLVNHATFVDAVERAVAAADRSGSVVALVFLDLDGFKAVNDTLGHRVGNELLVGVAGRLMAVARAEDVVARIGGDEFCVLISAARDRDEVHSAVDRIRRVFERPFVGDRYALSVRPSLGVAVHPGDANSALSLLEAADAAMYEEKRSRRGSTVAPAGAE